MNAHEYELSHELEQELEGELDGSHELELEMEGESLEIAELDGESLEIAELDGESLEIAELDQEASYELHELEAHEEEAEQFFGALAGLAARAGRSPALRRLAMSAARRVLESGAGAEGEYEVELELDCAHPVRRAYANAVMEHMGHAAAEAESEQEAAEAFLPLIPLAMRAVPIATKVAAKLAPRIARGASKVIPRLTRGVTQLARTLHRNPTTRPLMRIVPQIARGTVLQVARHVAAGKPLTGKQAVRILARQTARVLGDPRRSVHAWRRSRALDRRHHRAHPHARRRRRRPGPPYHHAMPPAHAGHAGNGHAPAPIAPPYFAPPTPHGQSPVHAPPHPAICAACGR